LGKQKILLYAIFLFNKLKKLAIFKIIEAVYKSIECFPIIELSRGRNLRVRLHSLCNCS